MKIVNKPDKMFLECGGNNAILSKKNTKAIRNLIRTENNTAPKILGHETLYSVVQNWGLKQQIQTE